MHNHLPMEYLPEARSAQDAIRIFQPAPLLQDVLSILSTDGRGRKPKKIKFDTISYEAYEVSSSSNDEPEKVVDDVQGNQFSSDTQEVNSYSGLVCRE